MEAVDYIKQLKTQQKFLFEENKRLEAQLRLDVAEHKKDGALVDLFHLLFVI